MPREIDDKKTRKALRKLRKAKERAAREGADLSNWEKEFLDGVEERLETYGSAFNDPEKGALDEALSARQTMVIREIDKKSRKPGSDLKRSGFGAARKKPAFKTSARDINSDVLGPQDAPDATTHSDSSDTTPPPEHMSPAQRRAQFETVPQMTPKQDARKNKRADLKGQKRPALRIITGGKTDTNTEN